MMRQIRFAKVQSRVIAPILLVLVGCSGGSDNPFANLSASNNPDDFLLIAQTFNRQVSTTINYTWQHTANVAEVIIGLASGGAAPITGTATITIRDAAGAQVYTHSLKDDIVSDTTAAGMPGEWRIDFSFAGVNGDIVAEVRRAARDLMVVATTTGTNFDADGFTVTMDGSVTQAVAANGSTTFSKVSPASHTVVLSGVAANCSLLDGNTRTAVVPAAIPVSVSYSLSCS